MAARSFVPLLGAADPGVVLLGFSFATNGSSDPVASTITGRGVASVVLASTGVYTITLQDVYPALLSATASLQLASADDKVAASIGAVDLTAKTIQVRLYDISSAALANVAAATGNRVNVTLVLKNSQV
jgi:hypothetical protein